MTETIDDRVRVSVEDDGRIVQLTLARADRRNAIDTRMVQALAAAIDKVDDSEARVVVLSADGGYFSVGGDIDEFPDDPAALASFSQDGLARGNEVLRRLHNLPVPLIVAARGAIAGGAIGFALTADIIVLGHSAFFATAFSRIGLSPDCGTSWLLTRRLTPARAADVLLTNRRVGAQEALDWGLASRVTDDDAVQDEALAIARGIASGSPLAVRATKRLHRAAFVADFAAQLDDERKTMEAIAAAADPGLRAAFGSRRSPS